MARVGPTAALAILSASLLFGAPAVRGAEDVATLLGERISRTDFAVPGGAARELQRFLDLVWRHVSRHYIEQNGLYATAEEVEEVAVYHREFERRDRAQRARKLEELKQRLAAGGLDDNQREWLEEFRAVLTRLARHDAGLENLPPPDPEEQAAMFGPTVERWKTDMALYGEYGGVVVLTRVGPEPREARRALIEDYERRGLIRFHDAGWRERLLARFAIPPSSVIPPAEVDFTPYWRRPIPPSYFPD